MPKSITLIAQGLSGGGAEMSMLRLAEELDRSDYDVRVAVLWKTGRLVDAVPEGIRVDEIGGGRLSCIPRLARYLAGNRPDVVIGFMTYANVVAILAQVLSLSAKKIVVSEHNTFSRSIRSRGGIPWLFHFAVPLGLSLDGCGRMRFARRGRRSLGDHAAAAPFADDHLQSRHHRRACRAGVRAA